MPPKPCRSGDCPRIERPFAKPAIMMASQGEYFHAVCRKHCSTTRLYGCTFAWLLAVSWLCFPSSAAAEQEARAAEIHPAIEAAVVRHINLEQQDIAFEYATERQVTEDYSRQLAVELQDGAEESIASGRHPSIEPTITSGVARFSNKARYLSRRVIYAEDNLVIDDNVFAANEDRSFSLNQQTGFAVIGTPEGTPGVRDSLDPRMAWWRFADGATISDLLTDERFDHAAAYDTIDGVDAVRIELTRPIVLYDGRERLLRKELWVVPSYDFLLKRAIAYSVEDPDRAITRTEFTVNQSADGDFFYEAVEFSSFPHSDDVASVVLKTVYSSVELRPIFKPEDFEVDLANATRIYDEKLDIAYTPTEHLNMSMTRDLLIDTSLAEETGRGGSVVEDSNGSVQPTAIMLNTKDREQGGMHQWLIPAIFFIGVMGAVLYRKNLHAMLFEKQASGKGR